MKNEEFFPDQFKASHQMETEEALHNIMCDKCIPFTALKGQTKIIFCQSLIKYCAFKLMLFFLLLC